MARELLGEDALLTPDDLAALLRVQVKWVYAQPIAKLPARIQFGERRWLTPDFAAIWTWVNLRWPSAFEG
ncbi:MAG: hypothetical protein H6826_13645 [Planctomycetes bacterium]|nr:hypothetical protein [Planctomycetota bacterium]